MKRKRGEDGESLELALARQKAEFLERELRLERAKGQAERRVFEERLGRVQAEMALERERAERRALEERIVEKEVEKPRKKPRRFSWLRSESFSLPDALLLHITTFLLDTQRFQLRALSRLLYGGFYNQRVLAHPTQDYACGNPSFNHLRAVRLARMGRCFPGVRWLDLDSEKVTAAGVEAVTRLHFPNLETLSLWGENKPSLSHLPLLPKLKKMLVQAKGEEWVLLTEEKFPELEELHLSGCKPCTGGHPLAPHSKLKSICFEADDLSVDWTSFTYTCYFFPSLEQITVNDIKKSMPTDSRLRKELEDYGVTFIEFAAPALVD